MQTVPCKTILQKTKSTEWFGTDYNMNLYRGCCHGCIYCDSRSECYHVENFDMVRAKENAAEILRDELRRKVRTGVIGTGAMCDPYNPFEKTQRLTEKALMLINAYNFGVSIITKSDLIVRDIDLYKDISKHSPVLCLMTVTTCDDRLSRLVEPNVSLSGERFNALAKLSEAGIQAGITMTPILPFIEDTEENILGIVRKAYECGVKYVYFGSGFCWCGVTLRQNQRDYYYQKLDKLFPGLSEKYRRYYGDKYNCISPNAQKLWRTFTAECERFGILYDMKDIVSSYKQGYGDMQLSFFD